MKQLDAMRGIAAIMVVVFHYTTRYVQLYGDQNHPGWQFPQGQYGVDFFFIISGFVIFLSLDNARNKWRFVSSRFWRLFPVYWAAVLLTWLLTSNVGLPGMTDGIGTFELLANFAMFHQYFYIPNIDGVYWTLALELAFYCWALVLYFHTDHRYTELILVLWVSCGVVGAALFNLEGREIPGVLEKLFLVDYSQLFAAGIVLFKIYRDGINSGRLMMLLFFSLVHWQTHGLIAFNVTVVAIVLILLSVHGGMRILESRLLLFFGAISYSLYLIHQEMGYILINNLLDLGFTSSLAVLLSMLIAIAVATLLTYTIELPVLRWSRRRRSRN
ncbi:MAG: acyltransferase [Gammaproteobacteria bacterium]|nr:acyltransferase [Gammaproteobacteria bacterium]